MVAGSRGSSLVAQERFMRRMERRIASLEKENERLRTERGKTVETMITEIRELRLDNERLRRELEEAHVLRIEAQNPGINPDAVRERMRQYRVDL